MISFYKYIFIFSLCSNYFCGYISILDIKWHRISDRIMPTKNILTLDIILICNIF